MKNSLKLTAAALAAISAMSCASVTSFADKLKTIDGVVYRYSDSGEVKGKYTGWVKTSKARYCYKNGVKLKNKWIKDKQGRYRYLDESGRMVTGWYEISRGGGKYSWFDENGYWDKTPYPSKYSDAVRFGQTVLIKLLRNEIISEPYSGNYSIDSYVSEKKAKAYINDNDYYYLEVPLAVAEQLENGDRLVVKAGVVRSTKENGEYTCKLRIPYMEYSALTASKINNSAPYEQKVRDALLNRFDLFNSLLVLRNDRLKLDMMYDAYRLDTRVLDEDGDNFFLTDDAQMYLINGETKEITYGLFGGYNKLNEKTGKYAFRDGITEKALLALMKEKIAAHRADVDEAKASNSDVDWYNWVGNMQSCWLDVTVVGIDWLPEAAAPTADMYEEYVPAEVKEPDNTVPDEYDDYILVQGKTVYVNAENDDFIKGKNIRKDITSPGEVTVMQSERDPEDRWSTSASVLPVGTKLWDVKHYSPTLILAEYDGRLIPYIRLRDK